MARGSGKSSLAEVACIWAVLNGYRDFVCLIGSDEGHACDMLDSIKTELDGNDLLLADYPEVCFPIQALDGIANRANGQLYQGKRTQIGWTAKEIVLPTIAGSKASGAIIKVAGLTGRIRGMKFKRPDGKTVRPSLVVLDDPQTDESARSLSQCANREAILAGAVLGLAGPGKKISGIMPCTVIRPGDMADNILDRDKHPEWNGERTRMVNSFPTNETLWQRYAEIRAEGLRAGDGGAAGTEFYRQNRDSDGRRCRRRLGGAVQPRRTVGDPARDEPEASRRSRVLCRVPKRTVAGRTRRRRSTDRRAGRCEDSTAWSDARSRSPPTTSPRSSTSKQKLLFYVVAAWEDDFTGYVIDYGTYPDQKRPYFTLRDARHTLATAKAPVWKDRSMPASNHSPTDLLGREWQRDDGAAMKIGRCLIDANWGHSTNVVYQFCRQSPHASILLPSHGRFVGASVNPFSEYKRRPGDRVGLNWRIPTHPRQASDPPRHLRHQLVEVLHARATRRRDGRSRLPLHLRRPRRTAPHVRRASHRRVLHQNRRPRPNRRRMESPPRTTRQPLARLPGRLRRRCVDAGSVVVWNRSYRSAPKRERVSFKELQQRKTTVTKSFS